MSILKRVLMGQPKKKRQEDGIDLVDVAEIGVGALLVSEGLEDNSTTETVIGAGLVADAFDLFD